MAFSPDDIRNVLTREGDRLFAPWAVGRPEGWTPDRRTREMVCLGLWLREELTRMGLSEADRKTQEGYFHRWSRSADDLCALAAEVLIDAASGNIEQGRVPHYRWG